MEPSNDHAGPLALTVHDCAQVLEVIAGPDGLDPRQNPSINPESYTEGVGESVDEISIGVIEEGFGQAESDPRVDDAVAEALNSFRPEVSEVQWTSVPIHTRGEAIFNGVEIEGMTALLRDETVGRYLRGYYDTTRAVAFGNASDERADAYPPTLKRVLLLGEYLHSEYHGKFYTIAQNLRRELITAYDDLFTEFDILALPTTPQLPHTYRSDLSTREIISYTLDMTQNTVQFNLTGHPAISVPCGTVEDLPVGLMLVAPMFDDARLLRVASAFERAVSPEIWQQPETS
jgi:amidase